MVSSINECRRTDARQGHLIGARIMRNAIDMTSSNWGSNRGGL